MTLRMGYWDCPSCGQKKNLGPNATCTQCGKPRGPNVPFYTDDSAPVIDDPELVARARAGADWKCKYCNADNRAGVMDCAQCGAGPDGSVKRAERFIPDSAPKKKFPVAAIVGIVVGVLAILGFAGWFFFFRTTSLTVTVDRASWVKSAVIQHKDTQRASGWADDVPAGARKVSSETRSRSKRVQDGTTKVKVGKKDLGNGVFEDIYEDKPNFVDKQVDDQWVTYDVDKWTETVKLKSETLDGSEPKEPKPDHPLSSAERLADEKNQIVLALTGSNGKKYDYEVDADKAGKAKGLKKGDTIKAKINGVGSVVSLGP